MSSETTWTLEFHLIGDGQGISYGFVKVLSQLGAEWRGYSVRVWGLSSETKDALMAAFTPERTGMSVIAIPELTQA